MHVRLIEVTLGPPAIVRALTSVGEITAVWKGTERPVVGDEDDVELSLESQPTWGIDLHLIASATELNVSLDELTVPIEVYDDA